MQVQRIIGAPSDVPPADAPSPPADATPEDPPGIPPDSPPLHLENDADEGVNVNVNVKAPKGAFFVRLTLQVGP